MFWILNYIYTLILISVVSSEVITLIKENNVTCVLTGDSIYSAVYLKNYETRTVARKIQEKEVWFDDDWSISNVTDHFDLVIDERWMDFGLSNHTSDFTSFSVCLNETVWRNTFGENDKNRRHFEHSGNFCQWKHLIKNGNNLTDENHAVQPFGLEWFTSNGVSFKNHKYDFKYSNVSSTNKSFFYADWSTCVSMYVSVDEGCYLNVTLQSENGTFKTELFNGTNKKNNLKQWTRIILQDDSVKEKNISFFRGTYNGNTSGFWAIDEIKDCNSDPVTYSVILENEKLPLQTRCETLRSLPETSNSTICKQNSYLGQNCNISCDQILGQFYNNCQEHQICSEKECYCAWGYQGATCNKSCDNNTWGINCTQKCNEECKVCDNIVGCTECNLSHFGNDGLKKLPIVLEAPELVSINENFIQILPNLKYGPNESEPQYFAVQYKKYNSIGGFQYFGSNYSYSEHNANISMNLTTTEAYNVRIILITDQKFCDVKVPELIINKKSLKTVERGNDVDLHWSPPLMKNVTMFWLEYQWNTFCDNHTEKRGFNSNMTQATFKTAPSSSSYEIKLGYHDAVIKKKVLIDQTNVMLRHSNKAITRNELPRSVIISEKKTILELERCDKFSGPVNYLITFTCLEDWCPNREIKGEDYEFKFYSSNISLKVPLLPNIACYNISVVAKRLDQKEERKFFRTNVSCNPLSTKSDATIIGAVRTAKIIGAVITATFVLFALIGILWWLCKRSKLAKKRPVIEYEVKFSDLQEKDALLEAILTNASEKEHIRVPLTIENFEQHVLSALEQDVETNIITEEFQEIPIISNASCNEGRKTENAAKNRYTNILPYDETRVVLVNNPGSDYINASYVNGYETPKAFIATQAPKTSTVNDFWLMVFQENVELIVMLTEAKEGKQVKSAQYWPEHLCTYRFEEFIIQSISTKITPNYVHRELQVKYQGEIRLVHHFQYSTWPDHDVPLSPQDFTTFIKEIMRIPQQSPVVVHCSAGCGRTGTYILCDIAIRMANKENQVDFVSILKELRKQRTRLVDNAEQYIFAHFVFLEYFFGRDLSVDVSDNFYEDIKKAQSNNSLNLLIYRLEQAKKKFESIQLKVYSYLSEAELAKNRFPSILPGYSQIFLPISAENTSSYINAVCVDCYRYPNKYIVTQQPLPETIDDFWKLVMEYEINTIINLNKIDEEDPSCPMFWPKESNRSWTLDDADANLCFFSVNDSNPAFNLFRVKLKKQAGQKTKIVNIISTKNWARETIEPPSVKDLISVWKKIMACSGKIVVTCYDGATASGLFVALAYMLEKINMEHKCDVFTSVKVVQQSRIQFIESPEQLKLLYQAAIEYIQEFSTYGNFS